METTKEYMAGFKAGKKQGFIEITEKIKQHIKLRVNVQSVQQLSGNVIAYLDQLNIALEVQDD